MIRPLLAELDLPQAFVRVMRSLIDRLPQQLRRHEVRAGAGREKAAVFNKPQAFGVDFTVAVRGCLDGIPGLCKSGRIENHNVILTAFPYLFGKKIEDVTGHISDFILQTVQRRVLARLRDRKLRSVNRGDMRCSCCCRVQTKRTGMGKTIQNFRRIAADAPDREAVEFLVEEEAGFLPVLHINDIFDAVFGDRDVRVKFFREEAFCALQPFFLADFRVAPLINSAHADTVPEKKLYETGEAENLECYAFRHAGQGMLEAKGQRFYDQNITVLVNRQPRQKIRLAEDNAAGVFRVLPRDRKNFLSVIPRVFHAPEDEGRRDDIFLLPREHPDAQLRVHVQEAVSQEKAVPVKDPDDGAVFGAFDGLDFVVVNPCAASL